MQIDQPAGPNSPRSVEGEVVESFDAPSYDGSVSFNGRRVVWLSRLLRPFSRFIFGWLAWRQKRRARDDSRTA